MYECSVESSKYTKLSTCLTFPEWFGVISFERIDDRSCSCLLEEQRRLK
jgi:hypothetical protein